MNLAKRWWLFAIVISFLIVLFVNMAWVPIFLAFVIPIFLCLGLLTDIIHLKKNKKPISSWLYIIFVLLLLYVIIALVIYIELSHM